jgi:hypothetical protein
MTTAANALETVEYRIAMVQPGSDAILVLDVAGRYCLPRVRIPQWTRPAQQLGKTIRATWGLDVLILNTVKTSDSYGPCVVAELLTKGASSDFKRVTLSGIGNSELSGEERFDVELTLTGKSKGVFSQVGWINEALAWIENASRRKCSSKRDIEQLNAGAEFALLRVRSDDGCGYWLKATGRPNVHELSITFRLSELCPHYLPRLIGTRNDWNAWLTEDSSNPLADAPTAQALVCATKKFALFQLKTLDSVDDLFAAGAFDQRLPVLTAQVDEVIAYLIDAMPRQTSTQVAPLSGDRLLELGEILRYACLRMKALGIPDVLIHNDLNLGNILFRGTDCVFTDWAEAAIGNPFLSCERLCQLNRDHRDDVCAVYRRAWSYRVSAASVDEAFALMPLLAIYAYLYGRGDWLERGNTLPQFESHARSLARHMDRAAQAPELLGVLCR